jgi:hypothetical protein
MKAIHATLQTTYANLLQAHLNRPAFEFDGAPFTRKLNNKTYWYANHRTTPGAPLKQRYLGPDTEEMRARIEEMRAQRQSFADFRDYASSLVAQLRAGGIVGPDRKTGPMLRALTNSGVFRLGGTLVGTHAFRHYDLVLGVHLSDATAWITQTDDIDIASFEKLSMAIEDTADPDLADALSKLGFKPAPSLTPRTPTSWALSDTSYAIDFLTPSFKDKEAPAKLTALNMWAQGLHYLNFLIADPIDAVSPYMEGLLIRIPRPERYAVHKLIISQRRRRGSDAKARKDIEQARSIIWAMSEDRPYELKSAIAEATSHGAKWSLALDRALEIKFSAKPPFRHTGDSIHFEGAALGAAPTFRISGSALAVLSPGINETLAAEKNRAAIEDLLRKKFRSEPSSDTLLRADDVSALRP